MEREDISVKKYENYYTEILDELYFVKTFDELKSEFSDEIDLIEALWELIVVGYVKTMLNFDEEIEFNKDEFVFNYDKIHYIATKRGLLWHNSL